MSDRESEDEGHQVAQKGVKRPYNRHIQEWSDEEPDESDDESRPNLPLYFRKHGIPRKQQIQICRTYANHIQASLKIEKK